ncbi:Uncharacterised protein [uncultured archaeon]|nr:Uncharacterised protein [uncultured archaeon]
MEFYSLMKNGDTLTYYMFARISEYTEPLLIALGYERQTENTIVKAILNDPDKMIKEIFFDRFMYEFRLLTLYKKTVIEVTKIEKKAGDFGLYYVATGYNLLKESCKLNFQSVVDGYSKRKRDIIPQFYVGDQILVIYGHEEWNDYGNVFYLKNVKKVAKWS